MVVKQSLLYVQAAAQPLSERISYPLQPIQALHPSVLEAAAVVDEARYRNKNNKTQQPSIGYPPYVHNLSRTT